MQAFQYNASMSIQPGVVKYTFNTHFDQINTRPGHRWNRLFG
jgi:hypothetical protein